MRIALDAMGTDGHPGVEIQGALAALRDLTSDLEVLLVGDAARVEAELARQRTVPSSRLRVVHAPERIGPGESPATAIRRKPDSSIVRAIALQREGEADASVSAGSTGAMMAASLIILRPIAGVDRPTVAPVLPTAAAPVVMLDGGANVDAKPQHLVQWARLGVVYAEDVLRRPRPRVGLLNIGEEPEKGDERSVEAHRLLAASDLNFVGNIEGRDIIRGACDVLVTDGFAGNVLLKFYESVAGFLVGLLEKEFETHEPSGELRRAMRVLDYTEYGGAPLLGVNGISIICHGGSPPRAISNAIRVAVQAIETRMLGHAARAMASAPAGAGAGRTEAL
ncbi:MAG: phosphate acyltransferase PlsX [Longimicrobiales bacterium]